MRRCKNTVRRTSRKPLPVKQEASCLHRLRPCWRIGGRIDLLKVDCEGAEWDFMRDPELFAHVGAIRMEYHLVDGRTLDDVHRLADKIGFKVTKLDENSGFGIAWLDRIAHAP